MRKNYVLEGDLTKYSKIFEDRRRVWDAISEFRTRVAIDLKNQHNTTALFSGPIGIVGTFYLLYPKDIPQRKRVDNVIHTRRPPMSSLIYFLEHIGFGILFGSCNTIASVEARKVYTIMNARVEIEIFSIERD